MQGGSVGSRVTALTYQLTLNEAMVVTSQGRRRGPTWEVGREADGLVG